MKPLGQEVNESRNIKKAWDCDFASDVWFVQQTNRKAQGNEISQD